MDTNGQTDGAIAGKPSIFNAIARGESCWDNHMSREVGCIQVGSGPVYLLATKFYAVRIQYGNVDGGADFELLAAFQTTPDSASGTYMTFPGSFGKFYYSALGTQDPFSDRWGPYPYWRLGNPGSGFNTTSPYPQGNPSDVSSGICYEDNQARDCLGAQFWDSVRMTQDTCAQWAWRNGFSFIGLQYGGQCFYGNTQPKTAGYVAGCTMTCSGDSSQNW